MNYVFKLEYDAAMKKDEAALLMTKWNDLQNILLCENAF